MSKGQHHSLMSEMRQNTRDIQHNATRASTIRDCEKFTSWARDEGLKNNDIRADRAGTIQQYVDHLRDEGYRIGTIHTYAAHVCHGLGVPMGEVDTPTRTIKTQRKHESVNERGREILDRPENARIREFAERVGIRRAEYAQLLGRDFREDGRGAYVIVECGKGGKAQAQTIRPEDRERIRSYFAEKEPDEPIFDDAELERVHQCNLHELRASHARAEYARYAEQCRTDEGREELRAALWNRFEDAEFGNKAYLAAIKRGDAATAQRCRDSFAAEMADGSYILRGPNRDCAIANALPVEYDRLALCCESVFALSHWRNEVTVKHYNI